jgi:hypothetical protein
MKTLQIQHSDKSSKSLFEHCTLDFELNSRRLRLSHSDAPRAFNY